MRSTPKKREIVAVQVDEGLLKALDALAGRQFRTRSDIIRQGLLKELEAQGICPVPERAA
jgi:metal-responsive CopG/Arc/MetJ family transcriptional regulator